MGGTPQGILSHICQPHTIVYVTGAFGNPSSIEFSFCFVDSRSVVTVLQTCRPDGRAGSRKARTGGHERQAGGRQAQHGRRAGGCPGEAGLSGARSDVATAGEGTGGGTEGGI